LGLVFVGSADGNLDAISVTTGQLVWTMQVGGDVLAPVFGAGMVYATSTSGAVEAFSESTGTMLWTAGLAASVQAGPSLDVSRGALVVCDSGGVVQEFNPTTGAEGWAFQASGSITASTAISGGSLYFGTSTGLVYALSELTGSELWSYQAAAAIGDTPTLTADITPGHVLELIVGDADGTLYFLDASNASVNYTMALGSAVTGVASVKGVVLAETASGVISSARSYSDLDVWRYQTGAGLSTSPVIDDGAVYVGAGDGKLYAFTSYGKPPD
jgi:outer membrane protein assembly factor BamB